MAAKEGTVIRPLGSYERYSSARHDLGFYRCVCNTSRYVRVGRQPQDAPAALEQEVEAALVAVVLKVPALRVGIAGEETRSPSFMRVPSIDLRNHLEWDALDDEDDGGELDEPGLMRILERRHDQRWPDVERRPPWRLIVVRRRSSGAAEEVGPAAVVLDMVFAVHHAVADGGSAALFHSRLLAALARPSSSSSSSASSSSSSPPDLPTVRHGSVLDVSGLPSHLFPAQEECVPFRNSYLFLAGVIWDEVAPSWLRWGQQPSLPWTGKPVSPEPHHGNLRLVTVPAGVAGRLIRECRAHGATLTSLVHVLVCAALSRRLAEADGQQADAGAPEERRQQQQHQHQQPPPPTFTAATPISLRPYVVLPPGEEGRPDVSTAFASLVTAHKFVFGPEAVAKMRNRDTGGDADMEPTIWHLAAELRVSLKRRLDTLPRDDPVGLLRLVGDMHARFRAAVGRGREASWELSNVGVLKTPPPDDGQAAAGHGPDGEAAGGRGWRITRSIASQGTNAAGPTFTVNVAGVEGGPVCLAVGWQAAAVDDALMGRLAGDLAAALCRFGESGRFGILD